MQQIVPRLAAGRWLGYGRWEAPYWFVGLEPAGDGERATLAAWRDVALPHLDDRDDLAVEPLWIAGGIPDDRAHAEFGRLILGYDDAPSGLRDVQRYQRELGGRDGRTALLGVPAPRSDAARPAALGRLATIGLRMREHEPKIVVFYGTAYRAAYQAVAAATFDDTGYLRSGPTLCTLVRHPQARPALPTAWWGAKGRQMRALG